MPQSLCLILLPLSAKLTEILFNVLVSMFTFKNPLLSMSPLHFESLATKSGMMFSLLNASSAALAPLTSASFLTPKTSHSLGF